MVRVSDDDEEDCEDPWEVMHRTEFANPLLGKDRRRFRKMDSPNIMNCCSWYSVKVAHIIPVHVIDPKKILRILKVV